MKLVSNLVIYGISFSSIDMNKKILILLAIVPMVLVVSGCISDTETSPNTQTNSDTISTSGAEDVVKIPISEVSEIVKFYQYNSGGTIIQYFVVRGSDGKIRTAFDACDVCGGYKGYRQEGGDVVCNNCGRHFSILELGTKNRGGGCWPSYLEHTEDGVNVIIKESDLEKGKSMF